MLVGPFFTETFLYTHFSRPLVACQAIQSLSLLLFDTKQDDMLHSSPSLPPSLPPPFLKAREPRPLVACQAIQSLSLLLFNTKQDDMLHYLLSQNLINDLLFFDMDVDGEEVGREGGEGRGEGKISFLNHEAFISSVNPPLPSLPPSLPPSFPH